MCIRSQLYAEEMGWGVMKNESYNNRHKDCKRALIDYMKENDIEFKYCHAREEGLKFIGDKEE